MIPGGHEPRQPIEFTDAGLVDGDDLFGFCGFCNEPGHRAVNCTALDPRPQCSPPEPGDVVWQFGVQHTLMPDGTLRERVMFDDRPDARCATCGVACCHGHPIKRLIEAIFCPACLTLRIHPTHLLVCDDRRRKVARRAR